MKRPGRKSSASLEAVESIPQRPQPPDHLNDQESEVWNRVVNGLETGWFRDETHDLLAAYCSHVITSRTIGDLISAFTDDSDVQDMEKLTKIRERESRIIVSLATKMRLPQQSTYDREKVKKQGAVGDPW